MNRRPAVARRGFALVLVLVFVMVALSALQALAALDAGATGDAAAGQLALDARALAQAAADELLLDFARRANDPALHELFAAVRATGLGAPLDPGFRGAWYPAGEARAQLEADRFKLAGMLAAELSGPDRSLTIVESSLEVRIDARAPGWPSPEVRGLLTARARVSARHGRRSLERTVERVQGLSLVRLAAGWPLDRTALFVRDARAALGNAPRTGLRVMAAVAGFRDALRRMAAQLPADKRAAMNDVVRAADGILAAWERDSDRPDRRTASYLYRHDAAAIADLAALDVGAIATDAEARFDAARARLVAVLEGMRSGSGAGDLGAACEEFLVQAETFHRRVSASLTDGWGGLVAHGGAPDRFAGALAATLGQRALVQVADLGGLATLWSPELAGDRAPGGSAEVGAVTAIDDAALWAALPKRAGSRLVLHVDGDVTVRDLTAPPRGLLTLVVRGRATLAGRVEASVLAEGGLAIEAGARVRGNLYHHAGPLALGAGAALEREPALRQPLATARTLDAGAYHVALDPFVLTRSAR